MYYFVFSCLTTARNNQIENFKILTAQAKLFYMARTLLTLLAGIYKLEKLPAVLILYTYV